MRRRGKGVGGRLEALEARRVEEARREWTRLLPTVSADLRSHLSPDQIAAMRLHLYGHVEAGAPVPLWCREAIQAGISRSGARLSPLLRQCLAESLGGGW